ncbi:hypothetical protein R6Z07F_014289 [Ovis aries]
MVLPMGWDSPSALATFLALKNTMAAFVGPVSPGYCPAEALLAQGWGKTLFSWACGDAGGGDGRLAFLPYDTLLFTLPSRDRSSLALGTGGPLQEACDAVLTISLESSLRDKAFEASGADGEAAAHLEPEQVPPLFGTICDAVVLLAHALSCSESHGAGLSGAHLGDHTGPLDVAGFSQRIRTDEKGRRLAQYVILDTGGRGSQLVPTHILDTDPWQVKPLNRAIHFPGGAPPACNSSCWFDPNTLCKEIIHHLPIHPSTHLSICEQPPGGLLVLALACVLGLAGRALTCLISCSWCRAPTGRPCTFIQQPLSRQRLQMDSVSQSRNMADGGSLRSVAQRSARSLPALQEPANMALYQWVWLKRFEGETAPELRPSCLRVLRKHCAQGNLEDLLRNEALRLDWTFKASLLLDLIHGEQYLHHQHFPHGRLKSRNCAVDGRFVLKVTDHGYVELLDAQRAPHPSQPQRLLWTAPELLRGPGAPRQGTLRGDAFSIGITLQEALTRGPPYGSSGLPAERRWYLPIPCASPWCPLVSPGHGPPECIQLMEQCWEEAPEDRPSLDQIYSQFKSINQGKKTSVADPMLRMLEKYSQSLEDLIRERTEELELERERIERLLSRMLPLVLPPCDSGPSYPFKSVTEALKMGAAVEPESFDQVTIYFSDVGFTTIASLSEPVEVVGLLNDLYTLFDEVLGNHDVYKVETIGDAYMVALGLPRCNGSRHAAEITNMALDTLSSVGDLLMRRVPTVLICIRAGPHSGPCVAGVVGVTMPRYCLFGDTLNTTSRMESTGLREIHVSRSTFETLLSLDEGYKIDIRGQTEIKMGRAGEEGGLPQTLPTPLDIKPGDAWQELINQEIKVAFAKALQSSAEPWVRRRQQREKSGAGRISSADLLEPPAPPDPAGPRTARAAAASVAQRFLRDPSPSPSFHPVLFDPPLPSLAVSAARKCFLPSRVPDKPSHAGARRPGARTPRPGRGGAWWGGSAGEVFKLEPRSPSRGSGSRGAVERPCASSGRDPGVWRGVGRGGQVCAKCAGAARERSGGRAEPGRSRPAGEAGRPLGELAVPSPSRAPGAELGWGWFIETLILNNRPPTPPHYQYFVRGARVDPASAPGS